MQETPIEATTHGLPPLNQPRSWFTFRGRMSRKAFWLYYGLVIAVAFVFTVTLSTLTAFIPSLTTTVAPVVLLAIMCIATWAIIAAMVRRLRDCGLHWGIVAAAMTSLFSTSFLVQVEMAVYALNRANGTLDLWLEQRFPYLEISGLVFLGFAIVLFYGLTRKGRGT